ncbi:MAG: hypothetical protein ACI9R3_000522 [Verrucomicrobiales bacterium]|jgi:hypothetical protein
MTTVTERWIFAVFAVAESDRFVLFKSEFLRPEACSFMASIAERLRLGSPAGTPPIVPGVQLHYLRLFVENYRFYHSATMASTTA